MKNKILLFLTLGLILGFSACEKDDPDPLPTPTPLSNVVIVDYNIMSPYTWDKDTVYIIPNTVKIDDTLTIEGGTIIKFHPDEGLKLWSNGVIMATGTDVATILFTSIKDDTGGDHNGDGNGSTPARGDWTYVDLGSQNGSHFKYCTFRYGGAPNYKGVLELGENSSTVEFCTFTFNDSYMNGGVYNGALSAFNADTSTIIKNNIFYSNKIPLSIDGQMSIDNSNKFSDPSNPNLINDYNGIFVHGQDIMSNNVIWSEDEVPFVIQYDGFEIHDNFTLTLSDNVVLKFLKDGWLKLQNPNTLINGQGTGVYFTSFKDDSKKGDTNNDGSATSPPPANEWLGVYNHDAMVFYTWSNILFSKNAW